MAEGNEEVTSLLSALDARATEDGTQAKIHHVTPNGLYGRAASELRAALAREAEAKAKRDEHFAEIKRAQAIIDDLRAERERRLTAIINADWINLVLAEDARIEYGRLVNGPYLAVKIAEAAEARCAEMGKALQKARGELVVSSAHQQARIFNAVCTIDEALDAALKPGSKT